MGCGTQKGDPSDAASPVHLAAWFGHHYRLERALPQLELGRWMKVFVDEFYNSVFHYAVESGDASMVERLCIQWECSTFIMNANYHDPLYRAVIGNHVDIVAFLLSDRSKLKQRFQQRLNTELFSVIFCTYQHIKYADPSDKTVLCANGVKDNPAQQPHSETLGDTYLMAAVKRGFYEIVQILLDNGASPVWYTDAINMNALDYAAYYYRKDSENSAASSKPLPGIYGKLARRDHRLTYDILRKTFQGSNWKVSNFDSGKHQDFGFVSGIARSTMNSEFEDVQLVKMCVYPVKGTDRYDPGLLPGQTDSYGSFLQFDFDAKPRVYWREVKHRKSAESTNNYQQKTSFDSSSSTSSEGSEIILNTAITDITKTVQYGAERHTIVSNYVDTGKIYVELKNWTEYVGSKDTDPQEDRSLPYRQFRQVTTDSRIIPVDDDGLFDLFRSFHDANSALDWRELTQRHADQGAHVLREQMKILEDEWKKRKK